MGAGAAGIGRRADFQRRVIDEVGGGPGHEQGRIHAGPDRDPIAVGDLVNARADQGTGIRHARAGRMSVGVDRDRAFIGQRNVRHTGNPGQRR